MTDKTLVLAVFSDEFQASSAAALLKDSALAAGDAIGVLALDEAGQVKGQNVGKRSLGKGAGIGLVLALVTPVGLAVGLLGGGILGALHHKGLGLDTADRERISQDLKDGKAAVGVLTDVAGADAVMSFLVEQGGVAQAHSVTDEALEEARAAAAADGS